MPRNPDVVIDLPKRRDYGHCHFCDKEYTDWSDSWEHPQKCLKPPHSMISWLVGELRGSIQDFFRQVRTDVVNIPTKARRSAESVAEDVREFGRFWLWLGRAIWGIPKMKKQDRILLMPLLVVAWVPYRFISDWLHLPEWVFIPFAVVWLGYIFYFGLSTVYEGRWKHKEQSSRLGK